MVLLNTVPALVSMLKVTVTSWENHLALPWCIHMKYSRITMGVQINNRYTCITYVQMEVYEMTRVVSSASTLIDSMVMRWLLSTAENSRIAYWWLYVLWDQSLDPAMHASFCCLWSEMNSIKQTPHDGGECECEHFRVILYFLLACVNHILPQSKACNIFHVTAVHHLTFQLAETLWFKTLWVI